MITGTGVGAFLVARRYLDFARLSASLCRCCPATA
jgi:hypothetical protein